MEKINLRPKVLLEAVKYEGTKSSAKSIMKWMGEDVSVPKDEDLQLKFESEHNMSKGEYIVRGWAPSGCKPMFTRMTEKDLKSTYDIVRSKK
jgi:hypothetical protein